MERKIMVFFNMEGQREERPVDQVVPGSPRCGFMTDFEDFQGFIPPSVMQTARKLKEAGTAFMVAAFEGPEFGEPIPVLVPAERQFIMRKTA